MSTPHGSTSSLPRASRRGSCCSSACDTGATVEARRTPDGYRFTARSFPTELSCVGVNGPHAVGFNVAPPQELPVRLIFSEPDGNDSVRVVTAP